LFKMSYVKFGAAIAACLAVATAAYAAVSFDEETGVGFVGKGDVQAALGWNNKQLQDNADDLEFIYASSYSTTTTWTCDRNAGPQTQERNNTTTTFFEGAVTVVARERNQVTGFILTGFEGTPTASTTSQGPAAGSCPTGWTAIDIVAETTVLTESGLYVNGVLLE
jgi:hypothetical protein